MGRWRREAAAAARRRAGGCRRHDARRRHGALGRRQPRERPVALQPRERLVAERRLGLGAQLGHQRRERLVVRAQPPQVRRQRVLLVQHALVVQPVHVALPPEAVPRRLGLGRHLLRVRHLRAQRRDLVVQRLVLRVHVGQRERVAAGQQPAGAHGVPLLVEAVQRGAHAAAHQEVADEVVRDRGQRLGALVQRRTAAALRRGRRGAAATVRPTRGRRRRRRRRRVATLARAQQRRDERVHVRVLAIVILPVLQPSGVQVQLRQGRERVGAVGAGGGLGARHGRNQVRARAVCEGGGEGRPPQRTRTRRVCGTPAPPCAGAS